MRHDPPRPAITRSSPRANAASASRLCVIACSLTLIVTPLALGAARVDTTAAVRLGVAIPLELHGHGATASGENATSATTRARLTEIDVPLLTIESRSDAPQRARLQMTDDAPRGMIGILLVGSKPELLIADGLTAIRPDAGFTVAPHARIDVVGHFAGTAPATLRLRVVSSPADEPGQRLAQAWTVVVG